MASNAIKSYSRFRPIIHTSVLEYDNLEIGVIIHDCKTGNTDPVALLYALKALINI